MKWILNKINKILNFIRCIYIINYTNEKKVITFNNRISLFKDLAYNLSNDLGVKLLDMEQFRDSKGDVALHIDFLHFGTIDKLFGKKVEKIYSYYNLTSAGYPMFSLTINDYIFKFLLINDREISLYIYLSTGDDKNPYKKLFRPFTIAVLVNDFDFMAKILKDSLFNLEKYGNYSTAPSLENISSQVKRTVKINKIKQLI